MRPGKSLSRAKRAAGLETHHVMHNRSDWEMGVWKNLREHPALTPEIKPEPHDYVHFELRRRKLDGIPRLPREWISTLLMQCNSGETIPTLYKMQCALGNFAVMSARIPEHQEMYVDLANTAIDFLGAQAELLKGNIYAPRIVFVKQ